MVSHRGCQPGCLRASLVGAALASAGYAVKVVPQQPQELVDALRPPKIESLEQLSAGAGTMLWREEGREERSASQYQWRKVRVGSHWRDYLVSTPKSYDQWQVPRPLLVLLHGFTQGPQDIWLSFVNLLDLKDGPIIVAPKGLSDSADEKGWNVRLGSGTPGAEGELCTEAVKQWPCPKSCANSGKCKPCSKNFFGGCMPRCSYSSCADDIGFLNAMLDDMNQNYRVSKQRTYLAGFSMGGMMAWDVATDKRIAHRFTAIAPIHGLVGAGTMQLPPTPESGPWVIGIWGGNNALRMDRVQPAFSNIPGRPDKCVGQNEDLQNLFYYSTPENTTKYYSKNLVHPWYPVIKPTDVMAPLGLNLLTHFGVQCFDDGSNGTVLRCHWDTNDHEVPMFGQWMLWTYFQMAAQMRKTDWVTDKARAVELGITTPQKAAESLIKAFFEDVQADIDYEADKKKEMEEPLAKLFGGKGSEQKQLFGMRQPWESPAGKKRYPGQNEDDGMFGMGK